MNLVERFFRALTVDGVRHGSLTSVKELRYAITNCLAARNLSPTRSQWWANEAEILAKVMRARENTRILVQQT